MKKRFPIGRVIVGVTVLSAGAFIAYQASREEGREQLAQAGRTMSESAHKVATLFDSSVRYATQFFEQYRKQDDRFYMYPTAPTAKNGAHQHDLAGVR